MQTCPSCGQTVPPTFPTCQFCGATLNPVRRPASGVSYSSVRTNGIDCMIVLYYLFAVLWVLGGVSNIFMKTAEEDVIRNTQIFFGILYILIGAGLMLRQDWVYSPARILCWVFIIVHGLLWLLSLAVFGFHWILVVISIFMGIFIFQLKLIAYME